MFKTNVMTRAERRIPMAVSVRIAGHAAFPGVESTFTEDVCARGARVFSARRWKTDERLQITTPAGDFRSVARVAWCLPTGDNCYAVGLQFVEPSGKWVIVSAAAS